MTQPTTAGVARCVLDLATDQVGRGWDVHVVAPDEGGLLEAAAAADAETHGWTAGRDPGPSIAAEVARLRRTLHDIAPDVVHLHSSKAGLAGRLALRGRVPTLFQPHAWSFLAVTGPVARAVRAWERVGARWAHAIVCVSADEAEAGRAAGVHGDLHVIPNGVDLERFPAAGPAARSSARRRLGLDDAPLVVCVGRLCRQKGQDVLVDAWPQVRATVPEAHLVLVGDGPDRDALARRAAPGVELVGHRTDVVDWLAASDVVALPSRWEGQSLSLLEAMACGRPVVASRVAGAAEPLVEGDLPPGGTVVEVEDAPGLAAALVERLTDLARTDAEGTAARARVARDHDLRVTLERTAALAAGMAQRA